MSSDIAIKVDNLSKCYQIYEQPRDRLKQFVMPRLQRGLGRQPQQYYREFWALKDVSFEVKKGETVGIIGRNGSGKSTLLQLICGTLNFTDGNVEIKGRIAALLELGSGFNPEFTGIENIYMSAYVLGLNTKDIADRIDAIIEFADIGEFIDLPVKTYSSGMIVRLAFAVISHVDANILVIDEALAVGDAEFSRKCTRFLRRFMETGTVLFVSHDMASIKSLCSRVFWMEDGTTKMCGDPKSVSDAYLRYVYEAMQGTFALAVDSNSVISSEDESKSPAARDMRQDFLNASNLRNDIQIFHMSPYLNGFGKGGIKLTHVTLFDGANIPLSWVVGGERVKLVIEGVASEDLDQLIVGFTVKDRLGQYLFGDNTFLRYCEKPVSVAIHEAFKARFEFVMPILRTGDYSIDVAVADGSQYEHVQQLWVYDALTLKSVTSSVCTGLIGVPIEHLCLEIK